MEELKTLKLFAALPSYDGQRYNGVPIAWLKAAVPNAQLIDSGGSLLANVFNSQLCLALRSREMGNATHFLMLHADIVPCGEDWFPKLWRAYRKTNAQMMSAVVPIKSAAGLTSTAIELPDPRKRWKRLTMNEVLGGPENFTDPKLLLNTGMLLFDLRDPWVNHCHFSISDEIVWLNDAGEVCAPGTPGSLPTAKSTSEDWAFTRQARAAGCERIYATRAVPLQHVGQQRYPNYQAWGMAEDDGTQ